MLEHFKQNTHTSSQYQKIDVLVIGGASAYYQSKVFGNYQNTPPSHLNEGDSSFYPILDNWILVVYCNIRYQKYKSSNWL